MTVTPNDARMHVLAAVSHAFASVATDYSSLLSTVARTTAEFVGDGCSVTLVSDDGENMHTASVAHRDTELEAVYREYTENATGWSMQSGTLTAAALRSGEALLVPEIEPAALAARTEERHRSLVTRLNVHGLIIAPIRARGVIIGTLAVLRSAPGRPYTPDDLALLRDLADRSGLAIENARLYDQLERRVRERTAELQRVNEELEAFGAAVSHDLRAPIRAIAGFSDILLEEYGARMDDTGRHYIDRIRVAADRMSALVTDLLELSRVTRASIRREVVDLSSLARGVVEELRRRHPSRTVVVEIAESLIASGDGGLIRIVFENLLANAWKFTSGRGLASVDIGADDLDGQRVFFVRDNGVGFDPAHAERLFAPFARLHASADFDGIGLGLTTVQRIISRHGGSVWAMSAVDQGATFFFTLSHASPELTA